jgi:amino acid transporter
MSTPRGPALLWGLYAIPAVFIQWDRGFPGRSARWTPKGDVRAAALLAECGCCVPHHHNVLYPLGFTHISLLPSFEQDIKSTYHLPVLLLIARHDQCFPRHVTLLSLIVMTTFVFHILCFSQSSLLHFPSLYTLPACPAG